MTEISIIIPVYNIERYLGKSLDALLCQTFQDFEVILVNDGSTDGSAKVCDAYAEKDKRIRVIHKENEGSGPTRNKGIEASSGKYLMFLDGDDWIEPNMLEKMYTEITQNNVDLVICDYNRVEIDGTINRNKQPLKPQLVEGQKACRESYIELLKQSIIQSPWNKIYKAELIKGNGLQFPSLRRCQDAAFNCKHFEYVTSYKIISDQLYNYRENDMSVAWTKFPKDYFDISLTLNKLYQDALKRWGLEDLGRQYLAEYFITDVIGCVEYCFSPKWGFTRKERKAYIHKIIHHERTREAIKVSNHGNRFARFIQFLIRKGWTTLLMEVMALRSYIKIKRLQGRV